MNYIDELHKKSTCWRIGFDGYIRDAADNTKIARLDGLTLYIYNRRQKCEVAIKLTELLRAIIARGG